MKPQAELKVIIIAGPNGAGKTTFAREFLPNEAARAYAKAIRRWQLAGYKVELIFLRLHNSEEAIARVRQRVLQGGHHIPDDVVSRRFEQGLKNLVQIYQPLVNAWAVYDNSGDVPQLIEWSEK